MTDIGVHGTDSNEVSHLLTPQHDLLLLEVASILLVDEYKVQRVAAGEAIIHTLVGRRQIRGCKVEAHWNEFALNGCPVHDLELAQRLVLGDSVLIGADRLLPND